MWESDPLLRFSSFLNLTTMIPRLTPLVAMVLSLVEELWNLPNQDTGTNLEARQTGPRPNFNGALVYNKKKGLCGPDPRRPSSRAWCIWYSSMLHVDAACDLCSTMTSCNLTCICMHWSGHSTCMHSWYKGYLTATDTCTGLCRSTWIFLRPSVADAHSVSTVNATRVGLCVSCSAVPILPPVSIIHPKDSASPKDYTAQIADPKSSYVTMYGEIIL